MFHTRAIRFVDFGEFGSLDWLKKQTIVKMDARNKPTKMPKLQMPADAKTAGPSQG